MRVEVAGGLRRPFNGEFHKLYAKPNIFRVIKSRRMRWPGHISRMGRISGAYSILLGKPEGKDHSEDLDVYRTIILEWMLGK
jgi:hypothetical protein